MFTPIFVLLSGLALCLLLGVGDGIRGGAEAQWEAEVRHQRNMTPAFPPLGFGCPLNHLCEVRWVHCGDKWRALYPVQAKARGCGRKYMVVYTTVTTTATTPVDSLVYEVKK